MGREAWEMELAIGLAVGLLLLLLGREVVCWYWKVNALLEEQRKQTALLVELVAEMRVARGAEAVRVEAGR